MIPFKKELFTSLQFFWIPGESIYKHLLGYREGDFPEAKRAARETFALPCFPELTHQQQQYVVDAIAGFSSQASN